MFLAIESYRPFIDPLDVVVVHIHTYWYLLIIPLCLFIAMAWKAVRVPDLSTYWRQVLTMTGQAIILLFALWVLALLVIMYIMPLWTAKGL